jgi:putative hemolysin
MSFGVWIIILCMVALNALFAAYEIALASVTLGKLKMLADAHRRGAKTALMMKENMEASLAVVQLGITMVGAIAAATGGAGVDETISPILSERFGLSPRWADVLALAIFVVPLSAITIVVGELIPKVFALKNKEWVCLKLSVGMHYLSIFAFPVVWVLEASVMKLMEWSERRWRPRVEGSHRPETAEIEELRAIVALARTSRLIGGQEEKIILGAARLSSRKIAEVMIPIGDIVTLDLDHTMAESLVIAHTDMHTRFPVCEHSGDLQSICGYVNFKDIVSELRLVPDQPSLRGIVRSLPSLAADLTLSVGLESLIREHVHIAIVRDGENRVIGMMTMEDIIEELVGDILDEFDRAPNHLAFSGSGWVAGGGVTIDRLEHASGVRFDRAPLPQEVRTVNDFIKHTLGRPVRGGDIIRTSGLRFLVRKVRRQQVMETQIARDEGSRIGESAEFQALDPARAGLGPSEPDGGESAAT